METDIRLTFVAAVALARSVIGGPEVAEAWERPSALRRLSVAALAGHTARAVFTVDEYLAATPPDGPPTVTAATYYAAMLPLNDIDSELNKGVRARAEQESAGGQGDLVQRLDDACVQLTEHLPIEQDSRVLRVIAGRVILLDEYLATRLVELALHIDDLCVSVGLPTPAVPGAEVAIRTLVDAARARHGDVAVLRALGRRERDPGEVLRVL